MNWEVYPKCIYESLRRINQHPDVKEIIITENDAAFKDEVTNGNVYDIRRVNFLKDHIRQVLLAKKKV